MHYVQSYNRFPRFRCAVIDDLDLRSYKRIAQPLAQGTGSLHGGTCLLASSTAPHCRRVAI